MHERFALPDWNALAASDDARLPLLGTALLIARDEYPQLDADLYDAHAAEPCRRTCARRSRRSSHGRRRWRRSTATCSRNSATPATTSSTTIRATATSTKSSSAACGNPISLALVQIEVARRLGVPLDGVSFPGHFLVRLPVDDGVLVMDPFNRGRPLDEDELRQRARPHLGGEAPDDRALFQILHPATHRAILMRVLRNLHGVYAERDDWERAARSADRILRLSPDNADALRDRGLALPEDGLSAGRARATWRATCNSIPKRRTAARCASGWSNSAAARAKPN